MRMNTKATKWLAIAGATAVIGIGGVGIAASANAAPATDADQAQVTEVAEVAGVTPDLSGVTFSTPVEVGTVPAGAVPAGEASHTTAAR